MLKFGSNETFHPLPNYILFVYLKGSYETLSDRMNNRKGHFMPTTLLKSQLETLEEPEKDENHIAIDVNLSVSDIIENIMHVLDVDDVR